MSAATTESFSSEQLPSEIDTLEPGSTKAHGSVRLTLGRAVRMRRTQIGLVLLGIIVFIAIFGPALAPNPPDEFVAAPYSSSAPHAVFGTDFLGRDVFSRFLAGGRQILVLALIATVVGVGVGAILGLVAGFMGGLVDNTVMRLGDAVIAFPAILLILLAVAAAGASSLLLVVVVAVAHIPQTARVIRGATLEVAESDFVRYVEMAGERRRRIVFREILPNVSSPLLVEFGLRMTYSVGAIASAAFLGLGKASDINWGLMISQNQNGLLGGAPMGVLLPTIGIAVLTVGMNLVTDGVARAATGTGTV